MAEWRKTEVGKAYKQSTHEAQPRADGGKLHPKPYLDQLANQMGGRQNLIRSALENANGRFPSSGIFELPVNVGGTNLRIRGFINNSKPLINTM